MDKDRAKGSATNLGGKVKEGAGKVTGDEKLQGEGKLDQAKGKVQNAVGGIKDAIKGKSRAHKRTRCGNVTRNGSGLEKTGQPLTSRLLVGGRRTLRARSEGRLASPDPVQGRQRPRPRVAEPTASEPDGPGS